MQFDKLLFTIRVMMRRKNNIVVGMTTFNTEMLRISIPALGKIRQKFLLILYNDNPMVNISRRDIRRLGYCGDLQVINTNENLGEFKARFEIIKAAQEHKPDWIIFCDDDDLLTDIEIPNVSKDNFAIIQNAVVLKHRVLDLVKVMENPKELDIDGENVCLIRPHMGLAGTVIRANVLFGLAKIIPDIIEELQKITTKLDFCAPVDDIMWSFVNIYAHHINPDLVPIYMDSVNYIKNDIDTSCMKYGYLAKPARNIAEAYHRALVKYETVLKNALDAAAAPRG